MSKNNHSLKAQVLSTQRQLSAKWSMTVSKEMLETYNDEFNKILTEEINNEILFKVWTEQGFYGITKPSNIKWNHDEISQWLKLHCTHMYVQKLHYCIFENKEEAVEFNLVYGS
jgi:hypothetical protein